MEKARTFEGIITLGIRPDRPETAYGYIEMGGAESGGFHAVSQFIEKPELRVALNYLKSGRYLWNAGIFVFRAEVGLRAFESCMPRLYALFSDSAASVADKYARLHADDAISIDFGVMEDAQKKGIPISVLPVEYGWSDLGSFTALEEIDKAVYGTVVSHNSASNIVQS